MNQAVAQRKPAKHFASHVATRPNGTVYVSVILTPPLDTEEQARAYAKWYEAESNLLYRMTRDKLNDSWKPLTTPLHHIVRVFETTLY
jgi:hypothetical protein